MKTFSSKQKSKKSGERKQTVLALKTSNGVELLKEKAMHEIVMDAKEIEACYKKVGEEISQSLKSEEKRPILLCVMKGAMTFLIGMMKYVNIPVIVDYIHISSYDGTSTTGKVNLLKDMSFDPEGRTIVIVEDVVDTGISMKYLEEFLATKKPKDIKVAAFVDKPARRKAEVKIDYVGKVIKENKYLVGNGFDYNEIGRNIPYVFVPSEEDFKNWDEILARDPLKKKQ
ncbi:MAG TPA: hypoxanthine phosphoribosyltransferase [Firmicutes bacterium]|nr:hypoxanthine phosphoribosyltransferase [Bacillota bacterium]